jgi:uncharacterized membrane protein YeaQ/YmgE (transglycosylase-associated protein family)
MFARAVVCSGQREEDFMSIIAWIVLGLIAGFIASKIVNRHGEGIMLDIVIGIVGAVVGGWIMAALGEEGVTGFNLYSMLVAVLGAVLLLVIVHAVRRPGPL